jgi:hypothetical protein
MDGPFAAPYFEGEKEAGAREGRCRMMDTHCEQRHGNGQAHGHGPAKKTEKRPQVVCPYCREHDQVIPIYYGYPSHSAFMRAERGEIYLGGSIAGPTAYYCKRDDREF